MDDSTDSCQDLFITQSTFRLDTNTQEAEEAANFFLDSDYDPAAPEVVRYLDFSNETDGGYTIMTESQSQVVRSNKEAANTAEEAPVCLESQEEPSSQNKVRMYCCFS